MNCTLLPTYCDLSEFKNFLPITFCGSIAIERSLNGLHTLYAGNPWWYGLPGTINIFDKTFDINLLSWDLIEPNKNIINSSKEFLLDILNKKTISNSINIGIFDKSKITSTFENEFYELIKTLEKDKN